MAHIDIKRWLWWRIALPPLVHLFGDLMGYLLYHDVVSAHYSTGPWYAVFLPDFLIITFGLYVVSEGNVVAYLRLEQTTPWERQPRRRLTLQLAFAFVWMLAAAGCLALALAWIGRDELSLDTLVNMMTMTLLATVGVIIIFFFQKMKSSWLETARMTREAEVARNHALLRQTEPHFLFNSLNTLTSLIMEDADLAVRYVGRLSRVYRYVLQSAERELVPLGEELDFVRDFAFGYSLRFGDRFDLAIDIPPDRHAGMIPPLTLQILTENCVKHNVIAADRPLRVRMSMDDAGGIVVENNLQRKQPDSPPTQVGLRNIIARYGLHTSEEVRIKDDDGVFRVRLPRIPSPVFKG